MSHLWLVRHGPTHAKTMIGWTDMPADLSDTAALARLSAHLPDAPVLSSDLSRAVQTANAIQQNRPRLPHDPALREIHFGTWEQRGYAEVEAVEPALIRAFWDTPGEISPPQGESWNTLRHRVTDALDRHLATHRTLIVICHFGPILTQIERALGLTTLQTFAHKIDPLSVTELHRQPTGWTAKAINLCP